VSALRKLRFSGRGVLDAVGGLVGRPPLLVPLAGEPGTVAMLTTPDSLYGDRALNPDNGYPEWQQAIAARSPLRVLGAVPAAGARLRPGSDSAGRASRPRGEASARR
jgi:hypothetical protein